MQFPRMIKKGQMVSFGAIGVVVVLVVAAVLLNTSFEGAPPIALVFGVIGLSMWFAFMGSIALFAIKPLEKVEIDRDEIRIRLGPLVLQRIPTHKIKTVGLAGFQVKFNGSYPFSLQKILVLSCKTPEQMEKKGQKILMRIIGPSVQELLREIGQDRYDVYGPARAYLQQKSTHNTMWLELSEEALAQLRRCLPNAVFLL